MKKTLPILLIIALLSFAFMQNKGAVAHIDQHDGPYVSYREGQVFITTVMDDHGKLIVKTDSMPEASRAAIKLTVPTGIEGESFSFPLKSAIEPEKSEYRKVGKQFVISDIEANFAALRKLLIAGGVIDNAFNWTFGEGHLVLTGDFVDRGEQQTEVLWLIYSLEDKAKAAGGYVHYVLGNHEIMNLSGDLRYLNPRYAQVSAVLGKSYMELLGADTELGRWLRSKNVIEKVGEMLYVHGGVSKDINDLDLNTKEINELSRPYYSDSSFNYKDPRTAVIYYDNGPFWYRGFYGGAIKHSMGQVDTTLDKHNVKHIVTGHTVIADSITTWFRKKVINVDVPHARGYSEGMLILGKKAYRVTAEGKQVDLLD